MSARGDWLRSRSARGLLWATLLMCLALGAGVLTVDGTDRSPSEGAPPLADDQAVAQVVTAARRIVAVAELQKPSGGYSFQSCSTADEPPYQAVLHATFALPQYDPARYVHEVAEAMTADGWTPSPVVGERFGAKLTRAGVTALISREGTDTPSATLRLYGECRNWGSHRDDDPVWSEVGL